MRKRKKLTTNRAAAAIGNSYDVSPRELNIDPEEWRKALRIDRNNLDEELEQQPSLFYEVAEACARARSLLDEAHDNVDIVEAELDANIRREAAESDERTTEKAIRAQIHAHPDRVEANEKFLQLKQRTEELDQLRDSFRQRGYMLRELVALFIAGYYQESSAQGSRSKAKESRAERNAERMAERRRARSKE